MIAVEGYSGCESYVFSARSTNTTAAVPSQIQHLIESLSREESRTLQEEVGHRDRLAPSHYFAKSSSDRAYCPRLLVQARKQLAFAEMLTNRANGLESSLSPKDPVSIISSPRWSFRTVPISLICFEFTGSQSEVASGRPESERACWTSTQLQSLVPDTNSTQKAAEALEEAERVSGKVKKVTLVMPFARHIEALTFLQSASTSQCRSFIGTIVGVVDTFISRSKLQSVPVAVFAEKLTAVVNNIGKLKETILAAADRQFVINTVIPWIRAEYLSSPELSDIPVGACHGDLTLSNILVAPHDVGSDLRRGGIGNVSDEAASEGPSLILIDFLDSFVESPLADLAKLKQDLCYCWTLRLQCQSASRKRQAAKRAEVASRAAANDRTKLPPVGFYPDYDGTKLVGIFDRFWAAVVARYEHLPWFGRYLPLFFLMNQLRVLQYAQDCEIATYLVATVRAEFEELKGGRL